MAISLNTNLTAHERVPKAVMTLMGYDECTALASVLMLGDREVDDTVTTTAATDGRDEWYNSAFVDTLTDPELRFVVVHECYHKMFKHLTTWDHLNAIDGRLANMACDYVINLRILDDIRDRNKVAMPDGGLLDDKYRDMDVAQVFNLLRDDKQQQQQQQQQQSSSNPTGGDTPDNTSGGFDDHDWDGAQAMSEADQQALAREIDAAVRQGALAASKMGKGGDNRTVDDLLKPQVDWRSALRAFITSTCAGGGYSTFRRPNKRMAHTGLYLPSTIDETIDELVIAADTSYSTCNPRTWRTILTELVTVCAVVKPKRVRILYWGSSVVGDEVYDAAEVNKIHNSTKPVDGGGTRVSCVTDYIRDNKIKATAIINITDGYVGGDWGTWDAPVLWCILDNQQAVPPTGKVLHIKAGEM